MFLSVCMCFVVFCFCCCYLVFLIVPLRLFHSCCLMILVFPSCSLMAHSIMYVSPPIFSFVFLGSPILPLFSICPFVFPFSLMFCDAPPCSEYWIVIPRGFLCILVFPSISSYSPVFSCFCFPLYFCVHVLQFFFVSCIFSSHEFS